MAKQTDLNGGKPVYTPKGEYYMHRRANPKSGIRKATPNQQDNFRSGYDKAFGVPTCEVCGVELLIRRKQCDECRNKED